MTSTQLTLGIPMTTIGEGMRFNGYEVEEVTIKNECAPVNGERVDRFEQSSSKRVLTTIGSTNDEYDPCAGRWKGQGSCPLPPVEPASMPTGE